MKTVPTLLATIALSASLLVATGANATLVPALGGQVVNDTVLNITWLANANLAATEHFGVTGGIQANGSMDWSTAKAWIAGMNAYNGGAGYLGYSDWRLPATRPVNGSTFNYNYNFNGSTDEGQNISEQGTAYAGSTGSEMAHLYYNSLDNKGQCNPVISTASSCIEQSGSGLVNDPANINDESLFTNLQPRLQYAAYWSSTEFALSTNYAWRFNMLQGEQYVSNKSNNFYALAVRSGQVATVPVPAAAWLLGSGLLGLIGVARRKAA